MTAAFLQSELTSLIADSKRKNADIKTAAEKSLTDLKAISVTSETQLAGDLVRKIHFIDPFVLACKSQNVRLASSAAAALQRLVASTAIPRSRLSDVLEAFEQAVPLALEVQLKVLQTLPSLLQLYASDLHGDALAMTLNVSADLSGSKLPMISSTAGATFQQLVTAVFARASTTSKTSNRTSGSSPMDSSKDRDDADAIFVDLCSLLVGGDSGFVRLENLPPPSALETLESLLTTYGTMVFESKETRDACTTLLMPGISTLIEDSNNFGIVVRAIRISFIIVSQRKSHVSKSLGILLTVVLRASDRMSTHKWKRVLGLEFFRLLCSDFDTLCHIFAISDMNRDSQSIVSELMASLVRTASEDPSLIGLGRQSTIPTTKGSEPTNDVAAAVEVPGSGATVGTVAVASVPSTGISNEWSGVEIPCLEQFDRSSPPNIPETYVYTLVLGCISAFSDGLSKYIMPLSVPTKKSTKGDESDFKPAQPSEQCKMSLKAAAASQKHQQLVNPLSRDDLGKRDHLEICAKMIESCWPAVLATCSTFLNAALDSYFYHMLIRTVQKLTQVSGVLGLDTPRDALLTTLAKVTVPANVSSLMNAIYGSRSALQSDYETHQEAEENQLKSPIASTPRQSVDIATQSLNVRNLLCLRALLNLGTALGANLSSAAWTIVFQSLEQVEALMSIGPSARLAQMSASGAGSSEGTSTATLAGEITAVETARRRMLESTRSYSESAFETICFSVLGMIEEVLPPDIAETQDTRMNRGLRSNTTSHKSTRSVSGSWTKATTLEIEVQFVLKTIGRLAHVNLHRFISGEDDLGISWNLIIARLLHLQSNQHVQPQLRLQCANIIDAIVVEACTSTKHYVDDLDQDQHVSRALKLGVQALLKQLDACQIYQGEDHKITDNDTAIICLMLEALQNVIASCGDILEEAWTDVFTILTRVIRTLAQQESISNRERNTPPTTNRVTKLYPPSFKVVQLIISDFSSILNPQGITSLLGLFKVFGQQQGDLNMSLTTIGLYLNVSALLNERAGDLLQLDDQRTKSLTTEASTDPKRQYATLWQIQLYGLADLCKDTHPDVRNAAARMLFKIIDASASQLSPTAMNACLSSILIPLLNHYGEEANADDHWQDSAMKLLADIVLLFGKYSEQILAYSHFETTWTVLIESVEGLLTLQDLSMGTKLYTSVSNIIESLLAVDHKGFKTSKPLMQAVWGLWNAHQPTQLYGMGANQDVIAAHATLLVKMSRWNFALLVGLDEAPETIAAFVERSLLDARHEQYSVDISKPTPEQVTIVEVLGILRRMLVDRKPAFVRHVLDIADKMISRTIAMTTSGTQPKPASKGTRRPTGIAFVTACIELLHDFFQVEAESESFLEDVPATPLLDLCVKMVNTKYSALSLNDNNPLWQRASLLGSQYLDILQTQLANHKDKDYNGENLANSINAFALATISAPNLEAMSDDLRPSQDKIVANEQFDISELHKIHSAIHQIYTTNKVSERTQKKYILTLFHYSLVARPCYNDLTPELENNPLNDLTTIRRGSIRPPDLPVRRKIYQEALECLFSLVSRDGANNHNHTTDRPPHTMLNVNGGDRNNLTTLTVPFILRRLTHTLHTFRADQPLRHLQHPHRALQAELHFLLRSFLDLRVLDFAFVPAAEELGCDVARTVGDDGKTHLRIMWETVGGFEECWRAMPRLKKRAWQEDTEGQGVEEALRVWRNEIGQGWGSMVK